MRNDLLHNGMFYFDSLANYIKMWNKNNRRYILWIKDLLNVIKILI
jgi:hypothetical protein